MGSSRRHPGLADDDVERLLADHAVGDEHADLVAFLDEVREAGAVPPSEAARERHLAAIGAAEPAASGEGDLGGSTASSGGRRTALRDRLRPRTRAARIALAGAALLLLAPSGAAGLATAGVVLPDSVRAPFEQVGIELPNQASADEVQAVIEATPPRERGCAFGQRVAKAAGGEAAARSEACPEEAGEAGGPGAQGRRGDRGAAAGRVGRGRDGRPAPPTSERSPAERTAREARRTSSHSGLAGEPSQGGAVGADPRREGQPDSGSPRTVPSPGQGGSRRSDAPGGSGSQEPSSVPEGRPDGAGSDGAGSDGASRSGNAQSSRSGPQGAGP